MGDKFNLTGDFRGAIVNLKSTLRNVHQTAGEIPNASEDDRKQLQDLIARLTAELEKVPPAQKDEVEAVAITATALIEQVKDGKKNKTLLRITAEGLKAAASNLAPILPAILPIVSQMIITVGKMSGTG
jgi:leucyl-tRNA synthetase